MTGDPRLVRTRELLSATLRALLLERPLSNISVSLLCREAGVHRTTFYGHAASVHQFAVAEFSADIDRLTTVPVQPSAETPGHVAARYRGSLLNVLTHVAGDRPSHRSLFASDSSGAFRAALESVLRPHADTALRVFEELNVAGAPETDAARAEASAFIAGAIVGTIDAWARSDEQDAAAASVRITQLMPGWWPPPS
jgi:AcrR family transcriptional regulator